MPTIRGITGRDALTRLPERRHARGAITRALRRMRDGESVAVAVVGLDRFSGVNTALGRRAGNDVLRVVADRLRTVGRAARLGGDEFAVIASGPDAATVGERALGVLGRPVDLQGRSVFLGASVGVAVSPTDAESSDELLQHADTAMQLAKERGGGMVLRYAGTLRSDAEDRLAVASALQTALERDELSLHYQPIVDTASRAIVGMEALVRWQHPTLGTIAPDRFIPIAEDTGLIIPLGEWVIEEACRQAALWQRHARLRLAVNLSARQFEHQRIDDVVAGALARSGLDPSLLDVELTERAVLHDDGDVATALERLGALGVGCSVDDFGTGYGGLTYLIRFPVVELKIDRSFVKNIDAAADHAAIVVGLINLARDLGLRVVAEGVEHSSQASFLAEHGCDEFQGYLVSRPLPPERFEALLAGTPAHEVPPAPKRTVEAPTPVRSARTHPAPVRPGPRRTRRRLAPAFAVCAAGAVLATTGHAGAVPAFSARTVAAIIETVDDVVPLPLVRGDAPVAGVQPKATGDVPTGAPASSTHSDPATPATPASGGAAATPATPATPAQHDTPAGAQERPNRAAAGDEHPVTPEPAGQRPTPGASASSGADPTPPTDAPGPNVPSDGANVPVDPGRPDHIGAPDEPPASEQPGSDAARGSSETGTHAAEDNRPAGDVAAAAAARPDR